MKGRSKLLFYKRSKKNSFTGKEYLPGNSKAFIFILFRKAKVKFWYPVLQFFLYYIINIIYLSIVPEENSKTNTNE